MAALTASIVSNGESKSGGAWIEASRRLTDTAGDAVGVPLCRLA
jgi:hypothetical protein